MGEEGGRASVQDEVVEPGAALGYVADYGGPAGGGEMRWRGSGLRGFREWW